MLWKSECVLIDGDTYFDLLFNEWDHATRSIDLETYIFDDDQIGAEVTQKLIQAIERGVHVRLLVDGIGSSGWWQTRGVELERPGLEVRVFHPLLTTQLWRRLMIDLGLIRPERKPNRSLVLRRLNRRNHRKVSIVDGNIGYVGSINITNCHVKRYAGLKAWRDTCARLEGVGVEELSNAFEHAWNRSQKVVAPRKLKIRFSFRRRIKQNSKSVSLNFTRRMRKQSRIQFINNLTSAKKRIWISNAYLAPPSNISRHLRNAAQRGVDVRIVVPVRSDVWFMGFISRAYYRPLLRSGIKIFEFQPRFLHAKSLVIDDEVMIGSSNLNRRSFLHDLEVDVRLNHPASVKIMTDQFLKDLSESVEVVDRGSFFGSQIGALLNYLFRYWV